MPNQEEEVDEEMLLSHPPGASKSINDEDIENAMEDIEMPAVNAGKTLLCNLFQRKQNCSVMKLTLGSESITLKTKTSSGCTKR